MESGVENEAVLAAYHRVGNRRASPSRIGEYRHVLFGNTDFGEVAFGFSKMHACIPGQLLSSGESSFGFNHSLHEFALWIECGRGSECPEKGGLGDFDFSFHRVTQMRSASDLNVWMDPENDGKLRKQHL